MDQKFITDALEEEILSDDAFRNSKIDSQVVENSEHDACTEEYHLIKTNLMIKIIKEKMEHTTAAFFG